MEMSEKIFLQNSLIQGMYEALQKMEHLLYKENFND